MSRVLILDDNQGDKNFIRTISQIMKMDVDVCSVDFRAKERFKGFFRHFSCLLMAFKAWSRRKKYSHFLFMHEYAGVYYSLISKITFTEKSTTISLVLFSIFNHKRGKLADLYYTRLVPWFLSSKACTGFVSFTHYEKVVYTKNLKQSISNKVHPILFGAKLEDDSLRNLDISLDGEKYYFSGGRSYRDYKTLVEAFRGLDVKLKIACEYEVVDGLDIPKNVEIIEGAYGEDFVSLMKNAQAIILPLMYTDICVGLRTLIDSMRAGKTLIVTGDNCLSDYIELDCMIPVKLHCSEDIRLAVLKLNSDNLAHKMSKTAQDIYRNKYTVERYGNRMGNLLKDLAVV